MRGPQGCLKKGVESKGEHATLDIPLGSSSIPGAEGLVQVSCGFLLLAVDRPIAPIVLLLTQSVLVTGCDLVFSEARIAHKIQHVMAHLSIDAPFCMPESCTAWAQQHGQKRALQSQTLSEFTQGRVGHKQSFRQSSKCERHGRSRDVDVELSQPVTAIHHIN